MRALVDFLLFLQSVSLAQECPDLAVLGVWQDPFQPDRIRLISENVSTDEIYDYPGWKVVDTEGNVLAEEQPNLFGLYGVNVHELQWVAPFEVPQEAQDVTLQLWTGFGEALACEVPHAFDARSFEWAGQTTGECLPVRLSLQGYAPPEGTVEVTLASLAWAGEFWSTTLSVNEGNNWFTFSDSLCLAQHDCYTLEVDCNTDSYVHLTWGDAVLGFPHATWTLQAEGTTVTTWDLYGDDCVTAVEEERVHRALPIAAAGSSVPSAGWPPGRYALFDLGGRQVRTWIHAVDAPFHAPATPGLYLLIAADGGVAKWSVR
jgi:hypothetical protein